MNPQGTETLSHIQWEGNSLAPDSEAQAAIKALPPGALTDSLVDLEAKYELFMWHSPGKRTFRGKLALWFAAPVLRCFRLEIAALARSVQTLTAQQVAEEQRDGVQAQFYALNDKFKNLRKFILDNHEGLLMKALAEERDLFDVMKELVVRAKS